ncbi:MAG: two-component regulator propeller domain-containing protein [Chitinophagales bacterium]
MKYLLKIISILSILCLQAAAQEPTYMHYTLDDGLPSMQIYDISQDEKGFIWLATAVGVSRFDGQFFKNYTTADGLPSTAVLAIEKDENGQLWLLSDNGQTAFIENKTIEVKENKKLQFRNMPTGDVAINYQLAKKQSLQTSLPTNLIAEQKKYFRQSISCYLKEKERDIWIGTWGGGAFYCKNYETDSLNVRAYLKNKTITAIFKDANENYWFTTLDEGVFLLTQPETLTFTEKQGLSHHDIYAITSDSQGQIWLGNSKGSVSQIQDKQIVNLDIYETEDNYNRINDIFIDAKNNKWLATDEGVRLLNAAGNSFILNFNENIKSLEPVKSLAVIDENNIWIGKYQQPIRLNTYKGIATDSLPLQQVNTLCLDTAKNLWIGTAKGLWHYANDTLFDFSAQHQLFSKNISDLKWRNDNELWIATNGDGLIVKRGAEMWHLNEGNGLKSLVCNRLFIDKSNNIWVATDNGLHKIVLENFDSKTLKMQHFSTLDGLAYRQVNDVLVHDDSIWVATLKGITFFRESQMLKRNFSPPIYIEKIKIAYRDTFYKQQYFLPYYKNNIQINYVGLSYQSGKSLGYEYRLSGLNEKWQTTDLRSITYSSLPSGNYRFEVRAIDKNGLRSEKAAFISFDIARPYWQTWWFRTLLGFFVLLCIIMIGYLIIKYVKERSDLQKRMIESQQMALRTQMNPHFIFNALNSIQYYITENDKRAANMYLSTFSTLMRKVLDNSQKSRILLEDELEYLGLYLDIESLRFKGKFRYELHISEAVEIDEVYVPPMLIQPYLENAIQHGLLQKPTEDRLLEISFDQKEEELLICKIKDNGIGRKRAAELQAKRTKRHRGIGMSNPKARLRILNQLHKYNITVKTEDLMGENEESLGTLIVVQMPVFYEEK